MHPYDRKELDKARDYKAESTIGNRATSFLPDIGMEKAAMPLPYENLYDGYVYDDTLRRVRARCWRR